MRKFLVVFAALVTLGVTPLASASFEGGGGNSPGGYCSTPWESTWLYDGRYDGYNEPFSRYTCMPWHIWYRDMYT